MKKLFKNIICLLIVATFAFSLVGCGGGNKPNVGKTLEIQCFDFSVYDGAKKDSIMNKLVEKTGVKFNLAGISGQDAYNKQLKTKVNTGEAPDVFFYAMSSDFSLVSNWADQGVIMPIDDYLADYPNLKAIFETEQFSNLKVNGKHYFIPRLTTGSNWAMYLRKDWIANLKNDADGNYRDVKDPETAESFTLTDFTYLLEAFTKGDPDGNGVNDTYGLTLGKQIFWALPIYNAFGVTPDWSLKDGKLSYQYTTEQFKNYLDYMRDLFEKGYLDDAYYENSDDLKRQKFQTGKCGMLIDNGDAFIPYILSSASFGSDDVAMIAPPKGDESLGVPGVGGFTNFGGYWGGFFFSHNCPNMADALKLFDYIFSPEGSKIITYGIEGQHYSLDGDGNVVPNLENRNEEPDNTFTKYKDESGKDVRSGNCYWGSYFTLPIDSVNEGSVAVISDYIGYEPEYAKLASEAAEIVNANIISNPLTNFIGWDAEFFEATQKISDLADIYAACIIAGSPYEGISEPNALWNAYLSKAQGYINTCTQSGIATLKANGIIQ